MSTKSKESHQTWPRFTKPITLFSFMFTAQQIVWKSNSKIKCLIIWWERDTIVFYHLNNIKKLTVIFNCLTIDGIAYYLTAFCYFMQRMLPSSNFIYSPLRVINGDQSEYQWYHKHSLSILKNPDHTQYKALNCTIR